jgi:hypothetical protein
MNLKHTFAKHLKLAFSPLYETPEGGSAAAVADPPEEIKEEPPEEKPIEVKDTGPEITPVDDIETYVGNERVNPEKRPLKKFDRSGLSKFDIDEMLAVSNGEMFMPVDKIPLEDKKDEKPVEKEKSDKKDEKPDLNESKDTLEFSEEAFFQHYETTAEEFAQIPEKIQAKMVETFGKESNIDLSTNEEYLALKTQYEEQQSNLKDFLEDPYVAARLEEIQTGQTYIASELPPATRKEIDALKAAETEEEFSKTLNNMIEARAEQAIANERTVANRKSYTEKSMIKASKVLAEVSKIDTRLAGNIKTENWNDIKPGHPDYKEFIKGPKKIVDYCIEKGLKIDAIAKLSPKELYAAIAVKNGWDKIRDNNIEKSVRSAFLKKIQKEHKQAKEIGSSRRSAAPMSGKTPSTGASRESLVEQLVSGDASTFDNELRAADGNLDRLNWLEGIQQEAIRKRREMRRNR